MEFYHRTPIVPNQATSDTCDQMSSLHTKLNFNTTFLVAVIRLPFVHLWFLSSARLQDYASLQPETLLGEFMGNKQRTYIFRVVYPRVLIGPRWPLEAHTSIYLTYNDLGWNDINVARTHHLLSRPPRRSSTAHFGLQRRGSSIPPTAQCPNEIHPYNQLLGHNLFVYMGRCSSEYPWS